MSVLEKKQNFQSETISDFFDDYRFLNMEYKSSGPFSVPPTNVLDKAKSFIIQMAVPGMVTEDFRVIIDDNNLIIRCTGSVANEFSDDEYTRREYNYSSFQRTFIPPFAISPDLVTAKYDNGTLKILIPKVESKRQHDPHFVEIM